MSFLKQNLKHANANFFLTSLSQTDHYIFLSSIEETQSNNSLESSNEFIDRTLFGKRIDIDEVYFTIKKRVWAPGVTYDTYSSKDDLATKNYYVTVYPQDEFLGTYNVFVCLYNNGGVPSTEKPVYTPETPDQIYFTQDGYIWEFVYQITGADFQKYNTLGLIPIIEEANTAVSSTGAIKQILVNNSNENFGYSEEVGQVTLIQSVSGVKRFYVSGDLEQIDGYYEDQSFYVTLGINVSRLFQIDDYMFDSSLNGYYVTVVGNDVENFIQPGSTFKITPRVKIVGNGQGATAIPVITNGKINRIQMIEYGEGYTRATAEVVNPRLGFTTDGPEITGLKASLYVVASPQYTNLSELFNSSTLLIYNENTTIDNSFIPTSNFYTKIGLVRDPQFVAASPARFDNRLSVIVENTSVVNVNDTLVQLVNNEVTFRCKVHSKTEDTLFLYDFNTELPNVGVTDYSIDPSLPLRTVNGEIIQITVDEFDEPQIQYPEYIQRTGEILYINSFGQIERTTETLEKYRIILQF
jgi:hypothetical protein